MTVTYTYDPDTGVVAGPLGWQRRDSLAESGSWVVCEHLRPTLRKLLDAGAHIVFVTGPGSWSLIDLDVNVDRAFPEALPDKSTLARGLDLWTNTDSHYPIQSGLSCKSCRQTLSWPPVGADAGNTEENDAGVDKGDVV